MCNLSANLSAWFMPTGNGFACSEIVFCDQALRAPHNNDIAGGASPAAFAVTVLCTVWQRHVDTQVAEGTGLAH